MTDGPVDVDGLRYLLRVSGSLGVVLVVAVAVVPGKKKNKRHNSGFTGFI